MIPLVATDVLKGISNSIHVRFLTTLQGRMRKIEKVTNIAKIAVFTSIEWKMYVSEMWTGETFFINGSISSSKQKTKKWQILWQHPVTLFCLVFCVATCSNEQSKSVSMETLLIIECRQKGKRLFLFALIGRRPSSMRLSVPSQTNVRPPELPPRLHLLVCHATLYLIQNCFTHFTQSLGGPRVVIKVSSLFLSPLIITSSVSGVFPPPLC